MTLEKLLSLRQPSDVQLSPDGARVAFVVAPVGRPRDGADGSRIWAGQTSGAIRQATRGPGSDSLPRFSPDGSLLAFASDRDRPGRRSLFVLEPGAEARPLGRLTGSVEEIRWGADGERLFVLVADIGSDVAGSLGAVRIGPDVVEDPEVRRPRQAWRRLFEVDLASGEALEVGPSGHTVWEFSLDRDRAVAVVSEDPGEGGWYEAWIATIDLRGRVAACIYEPELQVACPCVSPDGRWLAWTENFCSDRGFVAGTLNALDLESGERRELAPAHDVSALGWIDDSRLWVCGPRGTRTYLGTVSIADGALSELFAGPVRLGALHKVGVAADRGGTVFATVREAPGVPPEVAVLDPDSSEGWREISGFNTELKELPVPAVEEVRWEAEDGLEIEGLLVRPAGAEEPLPMIVTVHGGPTANWDWSFSPGYWSTAQVLVEAGYAMLLPNPRGSSGRGRDFARANRGDLGGGDFLDILAGVDACVARGIAREDQLGAWGISYGGFMSAWIAGNSDRFKAIVPVSCHTNWLSFHNTANIPAFDRLFVDADPYEANGRYFQLSPVAHAPKVTTPTLFLHGAEDRMCPLGQAEEMYRAIAEAGIETELVVYPREGHYVVEERAHVVDAVDRLLGWMDRHLRGEAGT